MPSPSAVQLTVTHVLPISAKQRKWTRAEDCSSADYARTTLTEQTVHTTQAASPVHSNSCDHGHTNGSVHKQRLDS